MKIHLLLLINLLPILSFAQTPNLSYDSTLAKQLGADDYGMKTYMFVILKTGTNTISDKKIRDSIFAGHLANINRLVEEDKLVVAGPFMKNDKNYRGLFILNVKTKEEADALLITDPAIKEKLLEPEVIPWYGSAALPLYIDESKKIEKVKF